MKELLRDFIDDCRRRSLSVTTCEGYNRIGSAFLRWYCDEFGQPATVGDWTRNTAEEYLSALTADRLKQTTRRRNVASLRSWGNWLVQQKHTRVNPWASLKTPVNEDLRQPCPTSAEVRALFDACDRMPNRARGSMTKAALALLALAGLRMAEMIAVTVADVQIESVPRRVRITWGKGGKAGSVCLSSLACSILAEWLLVRPPTSLPNLLYLNGHKRGDRPYSNNAFVLALRNAQSIARIEASDITAHALRRFFGTSIAAQAGTTIADVQHALRHSSPATTLSYVKPRGRQADLVEGILPDLAPPAPPAPVDNRERRHVGRVRPAWRRQ